LDKKRTGKIVSDAKKELFKRRLIATYNSPRRVYLTPIGVSFASRMSAKARRAVRLALKSVDAKQKDALAKYGDGPAVVEKLLQTQPTHLHSHPLVKVESAPRIGSRPRTEGT